MFNSCQLVRQGLYKGVLWSKDQKKRREGPARKTRKRPRTRTLTVLKEGRTRKRARTWERGTIERGTTIVWIKLTKFMRDM